LNCTPNDLFALRDLQLPESHALNKIQVLTDTAVNVNESLASKTMEEVRELLKK
jgi:hypothetical protein